ncbi:MAG: hypothetical protein ACRYHQ_09100 [Janthinobacterium lividum]
MPLLNVPGGRLAKRVRQHGTILAHEGVKHFDLDAFPASDLHELAAGVA